MTDRIIEILEFVLIFVAVWLVFLMGIEGLRAALAVARRFL